MFWTEFLGFLAGALITFSYIPQVIRLFRLKSAREISLLFTALLIAGLIVWLIYGVMLGLVPVIVWNSIGIVMGVVLLYAKIRFG